MAFEHYTTALHGPAAAGEGWWLLRGALEPFSIIDSFDSIMSQRKGLSLYFPNMSIFFESLYTAQGFLKSRSPT